jgi:hypothetical protein
MCVCFCLLLSSVAGERYTTTSLIGAPISFVILFLISLLTILLPQIVPYKGRQHYRLYTIKHIPTLKSLDFTKISKTERETADRLANSAAGAALESDVQQEKDNTTKTFVPGEGRSAEESFVTNFTPEQKELIRQMVAKAASPAEIEAIESSVRRGVLPTAAQLPATTTTPTTATATTNGDSRKRSASENGADDSNSGGEGAAKKTRVEEESPPEIEEETEEKEEDEGE